MIFADDLFLVFDACSVCVYVLFGVFMFFFFFGVFFFFFVLIVCLLLIVFLFLSPSFFIFSCFCSDEFLRLWCERC